MSLTLLRPLPAIERNVISWRKNWWVLLSGFFEPVFYLLGMGLGLGNLVGDVDLEGHLVPYVTFVAAGLMASSAMNGAIYDATFNFYFKMKEARTFDAMLYSPLRVVDVVSGELSFAVARGGVYALGFMIVALAFGAVDSWWALLAWPAAVLTALVFSAIGSFATTFVRGWADFDLVQLVVLPLFMGSTTFFPLEVYPSIVHPLVQASPLYNGVALIRDLFTGLVGWHDVGHFVYLVFVGCLAGWATTRRIGKLFSL